MGQSAVEGDSRPDHIEMGTVLGKQAGASREMPHRQGNAEPGKIFAGGQKFDLLGLVTLVSRAVTVGKVGIGSCDHKTAAVEEFGQAGEFSRRKTDAAHAGVNFQVDRQALVLVDDFAQGSSGIHGAQSRGQPEANRFGGLGGCEVSKNKNLAGNPCVAQLRGFLNRGDGKYLDAAADEVPSDGHGPVAVGIGFDHGAELHARPRDASDFSCIVGEGCQIDSRDRASVSQPFCGAICHRET